MKYEYMYVFDLFIFLKILLKYYINVLLCSEEGYIFLRKYFILLKYLIKGL